MRELSQGKHGDLATHGHLGLGVSRQLKGGGRGLAGQHGLSWVSILALFTFLQWVFLQHQYWVAGLADELTTVADWERSTRDVGVSNMNFRHGGTHRAPGLLREHVGPWQVGVKRILVMVAGVTGVN